MNQEPIVLVLIFALGVFGVYLWLGKDIKTIIDIVKRKFQGE